MKAETDEMPGSYHRVAVRHNWLLRNLIVQ
jgi:hypothetical protein